MALKVACVQLVGVKEESGTCRRRGRGRRGRGGERGRKRWRRTMRRRRKMRRRLKKMETEDKTRLYRQTKHSFDYNDRQ